MALNLGPEELVGDSDKFQAAVNALNEHGWCTDGRLHPTTMGRVKLSLAFIMEEIVDIALSHSPSVTLTQLEYVT